MKRPPLLVAILAIGFVLGTLAAAHYYIARRLVLDPGWEGPLADAALWAIALLGVGAILQPGLERVLPAPWFRWFSWPFVLWMGVFWIGFNATWIADLAVALASLVGVGPPDPAVHAAWLALAILVLVIFGLAFGLRPPPLRRVEHALETWPAELDGLRIAQISDIHIGPILDRRFAQHLVDRMNALDADLHVITGDLVDGRLDQLRDDVTPFADLKARHGTFFVTGNHDIYSGDEAWVPRIEELGIRPLRNTRVWIEGESGAGFWLAGVDDHRGDLQRGSSEDLGSALEGWEQGTPLVLLAHDPSTFKRAHPAGVDLQLSGHTHGGQIWPFRWMVRAVIPWVAGAYMEGRSRLYVSRGTGFWGPPMRLLAPAEITLHTLVRAS